MSVQKPSASAPPPSSMAPAQERAPSPSNPIGDAPTIDPPPGKKTTGKKKVSKKRVDKTQSVEPADAPAPPRVRDRYHPYRRADATLDPEDNIPADTEALETLDATAKMLYKSDREVLEYIEALKHRTAAMLEHVNRTDSQLRSCKGAMERMHLFVGQWQKIDDRWTHQQLFGDGNFRAKWEDGKMRVLESDESSEEDEDDTPNPHLFPTLTRDENGAFPTAEDHLAKNIDHPDFPYDYARDVLGESAPQPPNNDNKEVFVEAGCNPVPPRADPPICENSPEPSFQPAHRQVSPPSITTSRIQKEDSESERSQVIELLSHGVEQGESEDEEEPTGNTLGGLGKSQPSLPALTPDNTQATSTNNTQSGAGTPAEFQVPAEVPASIPEDVFGPIVLSAKANKISDELPPEVFEKDADGDIVMSDSEHEIANVSSKSTRFSLNGESEKKEHKVFRKTPIRPRTSLRVVDFEYALAAQVEAESQDAFKPLPSPKKKRVVGARARKPKATPSTIETEPTVDPENGLPSISASKPPSKLRRGRSTSVQPEIPALPKTPVRKSTRSRK